MVEKGKIRIAIVGFAREGRALFTFLRRGKKYHGTEIWILDKNKKLAVPRGVKAMLGPAYLKDLKHFSAVYLSPGVPRNLPEIKRAVRDGVKFSSATELFFEHVHCPVIGITGTKGKSTTSTLLYRMLKASGRNAHLIGNIGIPAIETLPKLRRNSIAVFELSSFQLHDLRRSPHIAVILGVFPDHMDSHTSFREYWRAKANVARWQKKDDVIFYAAENKYAKAIAQLSPGKIIAVKPILSSSQDDNIKAVIRIPGQHQLKNALVAVAVVRYLHVPEKTILKTIAQFRGLPHRLELARKISVGQTSIDFYNDSAATNPQTTVAAVKSFKDPVILLAGGRDKNLNFAPLKQALAHSSVKSVILYGENRGKIARAISGIMCQVSSVKNLNEAVQMAFSLAKDYLLHDTGRMTHVTILLSPASASFDQFRDYKERGEMFKQFVTRLK